MEPCADRLTPESPSITYVYASRGPPVGELEGPGQKIWVPTFRLGHLPSWPFARPALFQDLLPPSLVPAGTSVDIQDGLNDTGCL